jgi:Asp-tRNA(Asn)/Glu-tRNA(Gln) amidotransferase A subunit family amidase
MVLSALNLVQRIEAGELTPASVNTRCAEAIALNESGIGAFASLDIESVQRTATACASALTKRALRGLPVGVKDIFDTAELPTQYGCPIYANHRPVADAASVSLLRRAGGLIIGKTVTTELGFLQPANTRNPRNREHTPGGSSSGSAAAIAAGMVPIALGSQTGGSTIRPAAYCGVAGFKPSFGLVPTVGMKGVSWHLDTVGLFAAGIADVAFVAAAVTGRDLRVDRVSPAAPRLALVRTHRWSEPSEAMTLALERAAHAAEAQGAYIAERSLPAIFEEAFQAHAIIQAFEAYRILAFEFDHHREQLSPLLRGMLERGAAIMPEIYDTALSTAERARHALQDFFRDSDAILTPSASDAAPVGLGSTGSSTFNSLWTLMGTTCINVPGLENSNGLPLGVQIVGRFGHDREALEAAHFLEQSIVRGTA